MSNRRGYILRTPYEIQRRQRLQPVNVSVPRTYVLDVEAI